MVASSHSPDLGGACVRHRAGDAFILGGKLKSLGTDTNATGGGISSWADTGRGASASEAGTALQLLLAMLLLAFLQVFFSGTARFGRSGRTMATGSIVSRGVSVGEDSRVESLL